MCALDKITLVSRKLTVLQVLPALQSGGVERGTLEVGKYLVEQGHRSLVMSVGGRLVEQLLREGSEHYAWPIGKKSFLTLGLVWKLRRFLQEHKVDILHVRSRMPGWICYLAWKGMDPATRPRFVTTVHGPYSVNPYSAVMTRGERVIAISRFIRAYILENYHSVSAANIRLIYRGVDPQQFPFGHKPDSGWLAKWDEQYPQLRGKNLLMLPARITRWKGQTEFIDLIAALKNAGIEAFGLIVGEAHSRRLSFLEELHAKAAEMGVVDKIIFTGHRADVREIMAISNIVYSLAHEPEAFGRTTLEAISLGVPVIGYDHGGVGEILQKAFPYGLVMLNNRQMLLEKTTTLLLEAGKVQQSNSFPREHMLIDTLGVYEELALENKHDIH